MSRKLTKEQKSARFWARVMKMTNEPYCWLWTKSVSKSGYGNYYNTGAHKFAYEDTNGKVPKGYVVMHSCDNKTCVNPAHLSIGRPKDNSIDMVNKGRNAVFYGEQHGQCKLTDKEVAEIRDLYIGGNRYKPGNRKELAAKYNISIGYIIEIAHNKSRLNTQGVAE